MYINCMFCRDHLSSNGVIEHFPVGRRLAFDSAKGRLWVVCKSCARWNLTPLEERWEAIEECERLFAATKTRASTEHIGLAKTREGLELVRIGNPMRPEFAAWRYGDNFGRRWRRRTLLGVGMTAVGLGFVLASPGLGLVTAGSLVNVGVYGPMIVRQIRGRKRVARIPTGSRSIHRIISIKREHLDTAQLFRGDDKSSVILRLPSEQGTWDLENENAVAALRQLMPALNIGGGRSGDVKDAVAALERSSSPERFVHAIAANERWHDASAVAGMNRAFRLALEMAVNEATERAALEGELALLEQSWKDAEEIASIADNMFLPAWIDKFLDRHRPKIVRATPPTK